jgi:hypothetical protein
MVTPCVTNLVCFYYTVYLQLYEGNRGEVRGIVLRYEFKAASLMNISVPVNIEVPQLSWAVAFLQTGSQITQKGDSIKTDRSE